MKKNVGLAAVIMTLALPIAAEAGLRRDITSGIGKAGSAVTGAVSDAAKTVKNNTTGCEVKIKIKNKCSHNIQIANANFWHKNAANKYSIPLAVVVGGYNVLAGKSLTVRYNVLQACKLPKKADVAYYRKVDERTKAAFTNMNYKSFTVKQHDWQTGDTVTVETDRCISKAK